MTALDHLRKLTEKDPLRTSARCPCCEAWSHALDCPWVTAKVYVESKENPVVRPTPLRPFANLEHAAEQRMAEHIRNAVAPHYDAIRRGKGFTLIELLVVTLIVLLLSVIALPMVSQAISGRQVGDAARLVSASLAGARDAAIRDNRPSGIRMIQDPLFSGIQPLTLPNPDGSRNPDGSPATIPNPSPFAGRLDPGLPLAYNRIVPIGPAPSYSEGFVIQMNGVPAAIGALAYPGPAAGTTVSQTRPLVLAEAVVEAVTQPNGTTLAIPNPPTTWFWNIRLGDKIQINGAGAWYTVIGPMVVGPSGGNPEMFVNVGQPGTPLPWSTTQAGQSVTPEFLLLVNGHDDNANGWIDEGWDGVDNDNQNGVDDVGEWVEQETWLGAPPSTTQQAYTIRRRPVPQSNAREVSLPSDVVIDASGWGLLTKERTRVPSPAFNIFTGSIDIMVNPDGSVMPTTIYSSPSAVSMDGIFYHLWLAERGDVYAPTTPLIAGGVFSLPMPITAISQARPNPATGAIQPITTDAYAALTAVTPSLPALKGPSTIVTVFTKSGRVTVTENGDFNILNVGQPFLAAQIGQNGGDVRLSAGP